MKEAVCCFPDVEIECPYCGKEIDVYGDEFEKSPLMHLYATTVNSCRWCHENVIVNVRGD